MMQQTETYKLNLIEMSDTFSTAPLNENAEKTEAAILAETAARAAEAQARADADAALDQRVTVLEGHKVRMALGTYVGDSVNGRIIETGFTPKALILKDSGSTPLVVTETSMVDADVKTIELVEGGFCLYNVKTSAFGSSTENSANVKYHFIVFG